MAKNGVSKPLMPTRDGVSASRVFLPKADYTTILDFLEKRFPQGTRLGWERRMQEGKVLNSNGEKIPSDASYTSNQTIYYYRELRSETKIPFEEKIIYEDEWIVVADKPHFIPVTPIGPYLQESLLVRLRNRLGIDQLNPVHRLDLETAGLVLFTKQAHTRNIYAALFRDRSVKKQYFAVAPSSSSIDWPHIRSSRIESAERFMQMREVDGTPNAVTKISVLDTIGSQSLYCLEPITGKKHQLRVHMNALGLPIYGDTIYPELADYVKPLDRDYSAPLQLLANKMAFSDPITLLTHEFTSSLSLVWPPKV